jgi:hypothetical protein
MCTIPESMLAVRSCLGNVTRDASQLQLYAAELVRLAHKHPGTDGPTQALCAELITYGGTLQELSRSLASAATRGRTHFERLAAPTR